VYEMLQRRGLAERMVMGYGADRLPDMGVVTAFSKILPDVGWHATRHPARGADSLRHADGSVPVEYRTNILGAWSSHDPLCKRVYGWKVPPKLTWMARPLGDRSPLPMIRIACEQALLADRPGQGQMGADFWPDLRPRGYVRPTVYGRYPSTNEANAGMFLCKLLYPGPTGPVPTLRYELIREGLQECEARIFLEKLLTAKPCPLPARLAKQCQGVLDERTRWHRMQQIGLTANVAFAMSDWQGRSAKLYAAAAKAARAIAAK
ncbi:hypothetical protein LCGC14_2977640, partial [marine sediment metagenome]